MITQREMMVNKSGEKEIWSFTVNTEATAAGEKTTGIPFNLVGSPTVLEVDWGDNTTSILTSSDYTSADSTASVHVYENPGIYTITIASSKWKTAQYLSVASRIDNNNNRVSPIYWFRRTLISIDSILPEIITQRYYSSENSTTFYSANNSWSSNFYLCSVLTTIPSGLFDNNTGNVNFQYCFYGCSSLTAIPSGLFDNNTAVTNFKACFASCSSLTAIPSGLFDNNTAVTNFSFCFENCILLTSIPSGLFNNNIKITYFIGCFQGCSSLITIPFGLFNNNIKVTTFSGCFSGCSSITTIPSGLFDYNTAVTDFGNCFKNCSSLTAIPSGLFDHNTAVTEFGSCFLYCSSLTAIPSGLFDNNTAVTNFSYCFKNCSSLTAIPSGLFDHNTAVTEFGSCFYNCTSITAIPNGLFDSCTAVTNFSDCFRGCSSLTAIPDGLFDNNTAVKDFTSCFRECTSLTAIPDGLFGNNTAVTKFTYCFYNCYSLMIIPNNLFNSCTNVTDFSYCFYGCTTLLNFKLIIKSTSVSNFSYFISTTTAEVSRIVCVPSGSTTYTTINNFANSSNKVTVSTSEIDCLQALVFTIDTEADITTTSLNGGTVTTTTSPNPGAVEGQVPLYCTYYEPGNANDSIVIDWGDNTTTTITLSELRTLSSSYPQAMSISFLGHTYDTPGQYQITVATAVWDQVDFNQGGYGYEQAFPIFKRTLISVDEPLPIFGNTSRGLGIPNLFYNCYNLKTIPSNLFDNYTNLEVATNTFKQCTSLQEIPANLLRYRTNLNDTTGMFQDCTTLTYIPSGLLRNCTQLETVDYMFSGCTGLTCYPNTLFLNNPLVSDTSTVFTDSSITNPSLYNKAGLEQNNYLVMTLDPLAKLGNNATVGIPFNLYNQSGITLTINWGDGTVSTVTNSNYSTNNNTYSTHAYTNIGVYFVTIISSNWNNTRIMCVLGTSDITSPNDYNRCIYYFRKSLIEVKTSFPTLLGRNYLSSYSATTLSTINNNLAYIFQHCKSLRTIPSNLFENNTSNTVFGYMFYNCNSLQKIPDGLFDNNTSATAFNYCFYGCTSLKEIPIDIFKFNTVMTNVNYCFYNCSGLNSFYIRFTSSSISNVTSFCTKKTGTIRTLYVPSGSTTQTKFESVEDTLGLTIIPE